MLRLWVIQHAITISLPLIPVPPLPFPLPTLPCVVILADCPLQLWIIGNLTCHSPTTSGHNVPCKFSTSNATRAPYQTPVNVLYIQG